VWVGPLVRNHRQCYLISVFLRVLLGNRVSRLAVGLLILSGLSCQGKLVNLGHSQTTSATAAGGTTSTGGANVAAGSNSAGQIATNAGRSGTGGASGVGGTTVSGGSAGQSSAASRAGSLAAAGTTSQAGAAGLAAFTEPKFTNVTRVASLASNYKDDNPTLTSDLLELYFTSKDRPGGKGNVDVWVAKRDKADGAFGDPIPVLTVSTVGIDNSPAISADGLTIWVAFPPATDGLGGDDIMQATRATRNDDFGTPVLVKELSSAKDDIPRPLGNHNLTMSLGSRRDSEIFLTYFATRTTVNAPFGTPVRKDELIVEGANVSDAFLTDDGLTVYFARSVDNSADLYVARRPTLNSPFGTAIPLSTINTHDDDRDPWLSPDGNRLYFSSDRDTPGTLNIYEAQLVTN
jgi:hypothetical protein